MYLIKNISDLNNVDINSIGELSSSFIGEIEQSINEIIERDGNVQNYLINKITQFDSAINIIRIPAGLGDLESKANILLDNYNSTYTYLQSKYSKYGKEIFKPISERWRFSNYNSPFFKLGYPQLDNNFRAQIIEKIIRDKKSKTKFYEYEKLLIAHGFLNESRDKWKKSAASLYRFIHYCSTQNIFKDFYSGDNFIDAFKESRKLYNECRAKDYNKINKKDGILKAKPDDFDFLK